AIGRVFLPEEETPGRDRKVILSDGLWRRRFGGGPQVVGQGGTLRGQPSEVVGVMPPNFAFPYQTQIRAPPGVDTKAGPSPAGGSVTVIGRLADGRTMADAQAEMSVIAARLQRDFPRENKDRGVEVYTLAAGMRDPGLEQILAMLQAAALFVLLI